jgi:phosphoribosyl 1,2-cyclic phosphodiesterase
MIVTFHGVRGSTPCASDSVARHGGNTACVSVASPGEQPLLFDLGTGLRYFGDSMPAGEVFRGTALLSHLHWDHVQGLPFFRQLLCDGAEMTIHAPAQEDGRHPGDVLITTIRPPVFPIGLHDMGGSVTVHRAKPEFSVGGYVVRSADVPHNGANVGYRVELGNRSVVYITDHQQPDDPAHVVEPVVELCRGADLLIHDAQFTPAEFEAKRTWGHCTFQYAVTVAAAAGVTRLALFHHDPFHDDDQIDRMTAEAAARGAAHGIEVFAAYEGLAVELAPA